MYYRIANCKKSNLKVHHVNLKVNNMIIEMIKETRFACLTSVI